MHYHETYRNPNLAQPSVSGIYQLFPNESDCEIALHRWPEIWPQNEKPGVYMVFDTYMRLLYVGKAAKLGQRLGAHFQYTKDGLKNCRIATGGWSTKPAFLITIALEKSFEASSMEEYLIAELQPLDNRLGIAQKQAVI